MDDPTSPSPDPSRRSLPGLRRSLESLHARTWELEFFISGAVAFGLSRLPGRVHTFFNAVEPGLPEDIGQFAFLGYYYLILILSALIGTFLLHLASRAFWVGMVGLDSVFPRGIRWGELKQGPIARRYYRARLPSVKRMIRVGDSVSSVIFAVGWATVGLFLGSSLAVLLVGTVVVFLGRLLFEGVSLDGLTGLIVVALVLPSLAATTVDKIWGEKLDPRGRPARLVRFGLAAGYWTLLYPLHGAISMTLSSNLNRKAVGVATAGIMVLLVTAFVGNVFWQRGILSVQASPYLPAVPGESSVVPRHYEASRRGSPLPAVPTIQSEVVEDRYVRLFIPWDASRDEGEFDRVCPEARISRPGIRLLRSRTPPAPVEETERLLACAAQLWVVTLDHGAVADADYVFYDHPRTGVPGLALFLPTAGLRPGRHLLVVERRDLEHAHGRGEAPTPPDEPPPPRRWYIPFWI